MRAENHNFEVLSAVGESSVMGHLPPDGLTYLRFRFQPLEARSYHFAVPVSLAPFPSMYLDLDAVGTLTSPPVVPIGEAPKVGTPRSYSASSPLSTSAHSMASSFSGVPPRVLAKPPPQILQVRKLHEEIPLAPRFGLWMEDGVSFVFLVTL